MTVIDVAKTNLATLKEITDQWPSPDDIRQEHARDLSGVNASPNPDKLPFNLDRVQPTATRARTRDGATAVLYNTMRLWARHLDITPDSVFDYDSNIHWLQVNIARAYRDLPERVWDVTTRRLDTLTREAETICGYGTLEADYACPACQNTLAYTYTHTGVSDYATCTGCKQSWTISELLENAYTRARHNPDETTVTISQAAKILDLTISAVSLRIKRNGIKPCTTSSSKRYYRLVDLIRV